MPLRQGGNAMQPPTRRRMRFPPQGFPAPHPVPHPPWPHLEAPLHAAGHKGQAQHGDHVKGGDVKHLRRTAAAGVRAAAAGQRMKIASTRPHAGPRPTPRLARQRLTQDVPPSSLQAQRRAAAADSLAHLGSAVCADGGAQRTIGADCQPRDGPQMRLQARGGAARRWSPPLPACSLATSCCSQQASRPVGQPLICSSAGLATRRDCG